MLRDIFQSTLPSEMTIETNLQRAIFTMSLEVEDKGQYKLSIKHEGAKVHM